MTIAYIAAFAAGLAAVRLITRYGADYHPHPRHTKETP